MTDEYTRILEATERHLHALKGDGVRFLTVDSETLRQLREKAPLLPSRPSFPSIPSPKTQPPVKKTPVLPDVHAQPAAPVKVTTPAQNPETAMAALQEKVLACVKCPNLVASRHSVVFGVGDIHASLMFVGEAPGADEDRQGEPFVGAAGQLLTKIIKTMGYNRENVYIANVLKCRPDMPPQTSGNRKPTGEEMKTCLPYLIEQIEIIRPKVVVALGATAMEGLLGKTEPIGKQRGRFQDFRGIPLMPTFHPSYLLRNQALTEKRKVWEDMLQVMEKLNLPITEKHRSYFLKA